MQANDSRFLNVQACVVVADAVKSLLGPRSLQKLVETSDGILLTNDGATALNSMKIENGAAKVMVQLSNSLDRTVGDGTTSVVILAAALMRELLNESYQFMSAINQRGKSPLWIASKCHREIESLLEQHAFEFDPFSPTGRQFVLQTAQTTLSSKFVSKTIPSFAQLAVDSVAHIAERKDDEGPVLGINRERVRIITVEGESSSFKLHKDRVFLEMDPNFPLLQDIMLENVSALLIRFAINKPRTNENVRISLSSVEQLDRIITEEERFIKSIILKLKKTKIDVLLIEQDIMEERLSELGKQFLLKYKITPIPNIPSTQFKYLCRVTNASALSSLEQLNDTTSIQSRIIKFNRIKSIKLNKQSFVTVTVNDIDPAVSIILKGSSQIFVEEAKRALHDAICVVINLFCKPKVVFGAGVCESLCAVHLLQQAMLQTPFAATIYRAFAEALFEIPRTLAFNTGLDAFTIISQLKEKHLTSSSYGINVISGKVEDLTEKGIWECLENKKMQLALAVQCANTILSIDQTIFV